LSETDDELIPDILLQHCQDDVSGRISAVGVAY